MKLYSFKGFKPEIKNDTFIAPSVEIIGDVVIDDQANVWHGSVLRGDVAPIRIGKGANIQDLTMIHVSSVAGTYEAGGCYVGDGVTIGHKVTLHACTIGNNSLIGMGSIILDGVVIGENSLVGAGAVCTPGKKFPKNSMILGNPAKVVRQLKPEEIEQYGNHYKHYIELSDVYKTDEVQAL